MNHVCVQNNQTRLLVAPECRNDAQYRYMKNVYFTLRMIAEFFPSIIINLFDAIMLNIASDLDGDFGRLKIVGQVSIG